ncbi:hypothetical protein UN65_09610 [Flavobacterium columnare]|uniref:Uncharacterized protein n=2 Tax=Flavobacterium columnare TaxID=996 RepID=A0AAI8CIJ6_9FLAO|nr:hypothetical protein UN65_09610 [Flavobacterium columnare]MEB3801509.1 hypothetical protein [Flavobacterium columnare]QOG57610.1 hypothetical protein HUE29_09690 [Flavobacterium columnare]QOG60334.1 hypothetical protein HUE30_09690 [Flavobacterium columnare]QOG63054.1 hypothetical protein HUE31_09690 [Flavobacterium columnare]
MLEKKLTITDYGIYIMSIDKLLSFFKENKIKSKKVLEVFQKNHELYLKSLEEGVWIPILPIESTKYIINDISFNDEWQKEFKYENFNLNVNNEAYWIGSFGSLLNLNLEQFTNSINESISYQTLDGVTLFKSFKFNIENGKYLVNIIGYKRKSALEYPEANYGYSFEFKKVEQFIGYKDPREDDKYVFNLSTY